MITSVPFPPPRRGMSFWPRSLTGQMLLALALALLLAQGISTVAAYRANADHRREALVHMMALRLFLAARPTAPPPDDRGAELHGPRFDHGPPPGEGPHGFRAEPAADFAVLPTDQRLPEVEQQLAHTLADEGLGFASIIVVDRRVADDPVARAHAAKHAAIFAHRPPQHRDHVVIAAVRRSAQGDWLVARALQAPSGARYFLGNLIAQTLVIYLLLVGAMWVILRRITRPLAALTDRLDRFSHARDAAAPLAPEGSDDLRRLIVAHNSMEARIVALLDEKDVMLGAIGHDLKTPLAALRVRIEAVEDDAERAKMAATIDDIARSLDDILSLARVGRPSDPREPTELFALVASVVEEFEDMSEPVTLGDTTRITVSLRATWLRRALRNLIGNALRYGDDAMVSLARDAANGANWAVIRIDDHGPGIPVDQIERMLEPFTRGEPSRNSETGGAGLGLTLARAIAEQHGGTLELANRVGENGRVAGLTAVMRLPVR